MIIRRMRILAGLTSSLYFPISSLRFRDFGELGELFHLRFSDLARFLW